MCIYTCSKECSQKLKERVPLIVLSRFSNCSDTSRFVPSVAAVLFCYVEPRLLNCSSIALFSNHFIINNKWSHEKPPRQHSSPLARVHSRLKSQLWYVRHVLEPRPAQRLSASACMFYGWSIHYGRGGMAQAELKKEMGLQHVSGDHNHRKQEHNCLEYTDSRKCTTGEGQEGWEIEMDRAEIRGRFVAKASKVQVGTKARRGDFSTSFLFDSLCT